jgi:hypothetical protein
LAHAFKAKMHKSFSEAKLQQYFMEGGLTEESKRISTEAEAIEQLSKVYTDLKNNQRQHQEL